MSARPSSLSIARQEMSDVETFNKLHWALIGDVIEGKLTHEVGNTVCRAGVNILAATSLELRRGFSDDQDWKKRKRLLLATSSRG